MMYNIILYGIMLAVCGIAACFFGGIYASAPFLALLILALISLMYTVAVRFFFSYLESYEKQRCVRGSGNMLLVDAVNDSILFMGRVAAVFSRREGVKEPVTERMDFSLQPHTKRELKYQLPCEHIGRYTAGLAGFQFYDFLGLFRLSLQCQPRTIEVIPRLVDIEHLDLQYNGSRQLTANSHLRADDNENYGGVREYVPGDPVKTIHWKLTAHTSKYMTRVYEQKRDISMTIYIDLKNPPCEGEDSKALYDCLVESALSVALYGVKRRWDVEIIHNRGRIPGRLYAKSLADIERVSLYFAQIAFGAGCPVEALLRARAMDGSGCDNVIVVTASIDQGLAFELGRLVELNLNPLLIYAAGRPGDTAGHGDTAANVSKILEYCSNCGIQYRKIRSAEELTGRLEADKAV